MKTKDFNEIVEMLMQHSKNILCKKQDEYNLTDDRLDVFKKAARRQMITVPQALLGYMDKHIGSIYDYVHENKKMTKKLAQEKFGDAINYLYLLYAVLAEEGFEDDQVIEPRKESAHISGGYAVEGMPFVDKGKNKK